MRNIRIDIWNERDRTSIVVTNQDNNETLYEVWDNDVKALIDDGTLRWLTHHEVERFLRGIKIIKFDDEVEYT